MDLSPQLGASLLTPADVFVSILVLMDLSPQLGISIYAASV